MSAQFREYSLSFLVCAENCLSKKCSSLYNIDGYIDEYNSKRKRLKSLNDILISLKCFN